MKSAPRNVRQASSLSMLQAKSDSGSIDKLEACRTFSEGAFASLRPCEKPTLCETSFSQRRKFAIPYAYHWAIAQVIEQNVWTHLQKLAVAR
jgi:hypothetical protein